MILSKGKLWEIEDHGLYSVPVLQVVREVEHLTPSWSGPKVPLDAWAQMIAWFRKHPDHEVTIRGYLDTATGKWALLPYPQKYGTGMTVSEMKTGESPDKEKQHAVWLRENLPGGMLFLTVHHHCSASAFQSGTDRDSEVRTPGLHLTIGKVKDPRMELHGRATLQTNGSGMMHCTDLPAAALAQWLPESVALSALPSRLRGLAAELNIGVLLDASICDGVAYPAWWDDMLIQTVTPPLAAHEARRDWERWNTWDTSGIGFGDYGPSSYKTKQLPPAYDPKKDAAGPSETAMYDDLVDAAVAAIVDSPEFYVALEEAQSVDAIMEDPRIDKCILDVSQDFEVLIPDVSCKLEERVTEGFEWPSCSSQ